MKDKLKMKTKKINGLWFREKAGEYMWLVCFVNALPMSCASEAKAQRRDSTITAPVFPTASNGIAGNSLSHWRDVTSAMNHGAAPPAGEDCAMIYDPVAHRIVLFGGKNDDDENLNELWSLDLAGGYWQKFAVEGEYPPPCEDHACIYDPLSHRMIVHGGENGPTWNQIWSLDLQTHRWRNLTDSTAPRREDHTAVFDSRAKRMVIFGGRDQDDLGPEDLWAFDLDPASPRFEKWQALAYGKKHPPQRMDQVAVFDSLKNRMLIFGGWDNDEKEYYSDTWAFYFATPPDTVGRWKQIKTKRSHPPKRRHAVGVYVAARNWFVIFGGFGQQGYLNDVWAFDLTGEAWINITPGPQPRIDHQAIYDPRRHRMILYGGDARLKNKFHDIWELYIQPDLAFDGVLLQAGALYQRKK